MKKISFGKSTVTEEGPAFIIAEIGHNHQGKLDVALEMIRVAAECGVDCVKFQKRNNKKLFTKAYYNRLYDNENSFGITYGDHREHLEFGEDEYIQLQKCAEENDVELMVTAFDIESVDFLEGLGVTSYKIASADITNIPLIKYIAALSKPIFLSTGACTLDEIRLAYEAILREHEDFCLLHCTAGYPTDNDKLNLRIITTLKKEFPKAIIGYSGHDNGILAPSIAYLLGAVVIEKHFTLNHTWKGTDHKFSLEPIGFRKQVRDLRRVDQILGDGQRKLEDYEIPARTKMGKSIYASRNLKKGIILSDECICVKSPGGGLAPYYWDKIIGKQLIRNIAEEEQIHLKDFDSNAK